MSAYRLEQRVPGVGACADDDKTTRWLLAWMGRGGARAATLLSRRRSRYAQSPTGGVLIHYDRSSSETRSWARPRRSAWAWCARSFFGTVSLGSAGVAGAEHRGDRRPRGGCRRRSSARWRPARRRLRDGHRGGDPVVLVIGVGMPAGTG